MVHVSDPDPTQSLLPLSVGLRDPPSLCPNSIMTKSPDTTLAARDVKRPSSVYERADLPPIALLTTLTPVREYGR